jgi:hypothetical protein
MTLAHSDFPSSAAFDAINASLQSNEADRKDAIKKGGAVFAFTLKKGGAEESWYIDLKEKGEVGKGVAPPNGKATGAFILLIVLSQACVVGCFC